MIDQIELRLNNIVKIGSIITTVSHIMGDEDYFEPVELTPEILEAAGFTNGIKIIETSFLETEFYVDLMDGDAGFNKHGLWFPCKYLHQLQNLFYILSGQELQIDVNKLNK